MADTVRLPAAMLAAQYALGQVGTFSVQNLRDFMVSVLDWVALGATSASLISAAGTTQGTATVLATSCSIVTTVAANTGVLLLSELYIIQRVRNAGANPLNVYPGSGITIEALGSNIPLVLGVGSSALIANSSASQAYLLGGLGAPLLNLPTVPTGLTAGGLWRNGNIVNIV